LCGIINAATKLISYGPVAAFVRTMYSFSHVNDSGVVSPAVATPSSQIDHPSVDTRATILLAVSGVFVPLLLFVALALDVCEKQTFQWDRSILLYLHARSTPTVTDWMKIVSEMGSGAFLLPLALCPLLWLLVQRRSAQSRFLVLSVGGAALLNPLVKLVFHRKRPALWTDGVTGWSFSFPSGHAMLSMAVVLALFFLLWQSRAPRPLQVLGTLVGGAFVASVGLARMYLGVHFPSDVLGGWAMSLAWVTGVHLIWTERQRPAGEQSLQHALYASWRRFKRKFKREPSLK
jgi:membrane-associated phospholipid phosphatase